MMEYSAARENVLVYAWCMSTLRQTVFARGIISMEIDVDVD